MAQALAQSASTSGASGAAGAAVFLTLIATNPATRAAGVVAAIKRLNEPATGATDQGTSRRAQLKD